MSAAATETEAIAGFEARIAGLEAQIRDYQIALGILRRAGAVPARPVLTLVWDASRGGAR